MRVSFGAFKDFFLTWLFGLSAAVNVPVSFNFRNITKSDTANLIEIYTMNETSFLNIFNIPWISGKQNFCFFFSHFVFPLKI